MIRRLPGLAAPVVLLAIAACGSPTPIPDVPGCTQVKAPKPRPDGGATKPKARLDANKTNTITFVTSCGDFTVTLDVKAAPRTTASVASLARSGFYDHTVFHRVVPGFVVQGGDPTASGRGGPGYTIVERPARDAKYVRGVVAMAKKSNEAPGTAGSQFFVVTAATTDLPPDYAIIGTVTKGMSTVKRIESLGTSSQEPARPILIKTATFSAR